MFKKAVKFFLFFGILSMGSRAYCGFDPALEAFEPDFVAHVVANAALRTYADSQYNLRDFEYGATTVASAEKFIGDEDRQWRKYPIDGSVAERDYLLFGNLAERVDNWGAVYAHNNRIILAFHGSYWIADWIQNFKVQQSFLVEDGSGQEKVHTGFLKIVEVFFDKLKTALLKLDGDTSGYTGSETLREGFLHGKEIILTGHSLGGALAVVAGERFFREAKVLEPHQLKIITFSAPRVGNREFAEKMHKTISRDNIFNFVCGGDGVPFVPFKWGMNYSDVGRTIDVLSIEQIWSKASIGFSYFKNGRVDVRRHVGERFLPYLKPIVLGSFVWVSGYLFDEASGQVKTQAATLTGLSALMEYFPLLTSTAIIHHEVPTKTTVRIAWATAKQANDPLDPELQTDDSKLSALAYNRHPIMWWFYRKLL